MQLNIFAEANILHKKSIRLSRISQFNISYFACRKMRQIVRQLSRNHSRVPGRRAGQLRCCCEIRCSGRCSRVRIFFHSRADDARRCTTHKPQPTEHFKVNFDTYTYISYLSCFWLKLIRCAHRKKVITTYFCFQFNWNNWKQKQLTEWLVSSYKKEAHNLSFLVTF